MDEYLKFIFLQRGASIYAFHYSLEDKWFQESELREQDYRGWQFIPVNPAGVLRAHKEQLVNEEMGDWISR